MLMNSRTVGLFTALALAAAAARTASADTPASPWGISIYGGDAITEAGTLRSPHTVPLTDLGTLDPSLSGTPGTIGVDKLKYSDLYHRNFDTGVELNYSFSDALQTYGRFDFESLDGRTRRIGTVSAEPLIGGAEPLRARFDDQDNKSLELGSRYFWATSTDWKPFAGFSLGATRLDAMRADLVVPDTFIDAHNVRFTRAATVFSQTVETGVEYNPNPSFGVRFSVDADHLGDQPAAHDAQLAEFGFDPGHDAKDRWSFPVAIAAAYHFG
jgi:hypothetical protein